MTFTHRLENFRVFTFGAIIHLYESIKDDELRKNISLHYGIRNVKAFTNYLKMIQFIRNMSAHGRLLYDVNTSVKIYKTPLIKIPEEEPTNIRWNHKSSVLFLGCNIS